MRERLETPTSSPTLRSLAPPLDAIDHRYDLGPLLGRGASANVYAARDLRLERDVVVKVLHPHVHACATDQARFWREARILASFSHPNIVTVHDFVETRGRLCLVMEVASGGTLHELLKAGPLKPERALSLLLPVIGALAYAHDRGVVHRDVKPSNIALTANARGEQQAKLLDFGVARFNSNRITQPGILVGTPEYMAPEQVLSNDVGPYTDVWAMGVVLFTCLAGRLPFRRAPTVDLLNEIATQRPALLRELCPSLAPLLAQAIDKALAPRLAMRHANMREFARALAAACALENIAVARDPNPVGLPDFSWWLSRADYRTTRPPAPPFAAPQARQDQPAPAPMAKSKTALRTKLLVACALLVGFLAGQAGWGYLAVRLREPVRARALHEHDRMRERAPSARTAPSYAIFSSVGPPLGKPSSAPRARLPQATAFQANTQVESATPAVESEDPPRALHPDLQDPFAPRPAPPNDVVIDPWQ